MNHSSGAGRHAVLAHNLRRAGTALIDLVQEIDPGNWSHVPGPGVWSAGKEAEHIAEAVAYHLWIVRRTTGQQVPSRRPALERDELTSRLSQSEVADLLRERVKEGVGLIGSLTDQQLALPTRPPRAKGEVLAGTIERVLIGHIHIHRQEIESKLQR